MCMKGHFFPNTYVYFSVVNELQFKVACHRAPDKIEGQN